MAGGKRVNLYFGDPLIRISTRRACSPTKGSIHWEDRAPVIVLVAVPDLHPDLTAIPYYCRTGDGLSDDPFAVPLGTAARALLQPLWITAPDRRSRRLAMQTLENLLKAFRIAVLCAVSLDRDRLRS